VLYHLISPQEWESVKEKTHYKPKSLESEGFIHLSTYEQFKETYNRYYSGQEILVLEIDETKVTHEIKYEENDHGIFPHLFGPLNIEAVIGIERLENE
jgi:uncharacterized protein (DUF952 family)